MIMILVLPWKVIVIYPILKQTFESIKYNTLINKENEHNM